MKRNLALLVFLIATLAAAAQEPDAMPRRFTAVLAGTGGPGPGGATTVSVTIERWTTAEERAALVKALAEGGTDDLVEAMQDPDVGFIRVGGSLGWRLRVASSFETEAGRVVRIVTDRPILFREQWRGTRSRDYPIGVAEFTLPPDGPGEGALLAATQVRFDEQGRIEVKSLPQNTGPQRLMSVREEPVKKKKKKAKKEESGSS